MIFTWWKKINHRTNIIEKQGSAYTIARNDRSGLIDKVQSKWLLSENNFSLFYKQMRAIFDFFLRLFLFFSTFSFPPAC